MKKHLFYLFPALILIGCAEDFDLAGTPDTKGEEETAEAPQTRSLDGAIFNEVTDSWMIPQPDPFTLDNVQAAYDRLASGESTQNLTRSEAAEFTTGTKLAPTHYALKIYPRTEEEQSRVEMMEDVDVVYMPFSYSQLTQEEATRVEQSGKTRSGANTFTEKSPYTVTYDDMESTDGGPTGPVTFRLPILYAVWPADKPLPEDLEYVIDYEVFLPHATPNIKSVETLTILQNETQISVLGYLMSVPDTTTEIGMTRAPSNIARGRLVFKDDSILVPAQGGFMTVPMTGLELSIRVGSNIQTSVTDSNGCFSFNATANGLSLLVSINYKSPKWRISRGPNGWMSHTNIEVSASLFSGQCPTTELSLNESNRMLYNVHRAANYFFNVQTSFPRNAPTGGLAIRVLDQSNPNGDGSFVYNLTSSECFVNIYNNNINNPNGNNIVLGTTLHELGHFAHFWNNNNRYRGTHDLLRESFASYSGWYLGETYLKSIGWSNSSISWPDASSKSNITGQSRQGWLKSMGITYATSNPSEKYYSPLFIDMADDYCQFSNTMPNDVPFDIVKGATPSEVWSIASTSQTWAQCKPKLINWADANFTGDELDAYKIAYLWAFDYWFENE